jgi:dTDP-4-dehydrorhamnose reductase
MKVLVTGANGFLGYYLCSILLQKGYNVTATGKGACRLPFIGESLFAYEEMDFTDPFSVHDVFTAYQPEIVIHAGANTRPDDCELNQWAAYVTNVESTVTLLTNAEALNCYFLFISTDFVFDGNHGPYSENSLRAPVNYYGKTKVEAEDAVMEYAGSWAIVRTSLVYGAPKTGRGNLLTVVAEKIKSGTEYKVFHDQVRTPTFVEDLCFGILRIVELKARGIFHLAGADEQTPYQMAIATATYLGCNKDLIVKVTKDDFSQPAQRPANTVLISDKAKNELGYNPRVFKQGLEQTFLGY